MSQVEVATPETPKPPYNSGWTHLNPNSQKSNPYIVNQVEVATPGRLWEQLQLNDPFLTSLSLTHTHTHSHTHIHTFTHTHTHQAGLRSLGRTGGTRGRRCPPLKPFTLHPKP